MGALRFDARYLKRPVNRNEAALKRFLRAAPGSFLIGYKFDEGVVSMVMKVLKATEPTEWPTLPQLAKQLDMSAATLRRQLLQQGHSYRSLKADLKRERAQTLLRETHLPVSEISNRLGYAEPSAFFRAFRRWTTKRQKHGESLATLSDSWPRVTAHDIEVARRPAQHVVRPLSVRCCEGQTIFLPQP